MNYDDVSRLRSLSERLCPWAKYRGKARLRVSSINLVNYPAVVVSNSEVGGFVVFVKPDALDTIRLRWAGPSIDGGIPSDDEIAAWLTYCVLDLGGDGIREA